MITNIAYGLVFFVVFMVILRLVQNIGIILLIALVSLAAYGVTHSLLRARDMSEGHVLKTAYMLVSTANYWMQKGESKFRVYERATFPNLYQEVKDTLVIEEGFVKP